MRRLLVKKTGTVIPGTDRERSLKKRYLEIIKGFPKTDEKRGGSKTVSIDRSHSRRIKCRGPSFFRCRLIRVQSPFPLQLLRSVWLPTFALSYSSCLLCRCYSLSVLTDERRGGGGEGHKKDDSKNLLPSENLSKSAEASPLCR
jgi:hypothetical protein